MDGGRHVDRDRGRTPEGDLDPDKVAHELESFGRQYAEAHAAAKLLEEQKAIMRATLVQHYREQKKTRADAEDLAVMDAEYANHIETMVEMRRQANNAKACWLAAQARFEAMRTAEASRRAEIQHLSRTR